MACFARACGILFPKSRSGYAARLPRLVTTGRAGSASAPIFSEVAGDETRGRITKSRRQPGAQSVTTGASQQLSQPARRSRNQENQENQENSMNNQEKCIYEESPIRGANQELSQSPRAPASSSTSQPGCPEIKKIKKSKKTQ